MLVQQRVFSAIVAAPKNGATLHHMRHWRPQQEMADRHDPPKLRSFFLWWFYKSMLITNIHPLVGNHPYCFPRLWRFEPLLHFDSTGGVAEDFHQIGPENFLNVDMNKHDYTCHRPFLENGWLELITVMAASGFWKKTWDDFWLQKKEAELSLRAARSTPGRYKASSVRRQRSWRCSWDEKWGHG